MFDVKERKLPPKEPITLESMSYYCTYRNDRGSVVLKLPYSIGDVSGDCFLLVDGTKYVGRVYGADNLRSDATWERYHSEVKFEA